ncbi:Crp/Fnr family transcriptional regulator [Candidatus Microgenomates bacterium]|jgi:CRP-like cAMP-binding protein|nr:MAG: Crp/Fnr family transcriptional regulator [Candidatus Microgenomates bacterium]
MEKPDFETIFESLTPVKLFKGDKIGKNTEGNLLTYIKSGYVRLYTVLASGEEVTLHIFKPGLFLPILTDKIIPGKYTLEALTSVEVYEISEDDLAKLGISNPEAVVPLLRVGFEGVEELFDRIESLASGDAYTKVVSFFCLLFNNENGSKNLKPGFPLTHRVVASLTGLTRETVTIQMLKLKKKGLIVGKGRNLMIKDLELLRKECPLSEE